MLGDDDVLAFDWGTSIIGILDVNRNTYTPYRFKTGMLEGARRIATCRGTIVSFNGNGYDLIEIAKILGVPKLKLTEGCRHDDMAEVVSRTRWPPEPGTSPIWGQNLEDTYQYYFPDDAPIAPAALTDGYIINNWRDCYMPAELWKKWKRNDLGP